MSTSLPNVQPAHEMNDPKIQVLLDELYKELHYLKSRCLLEPYSLYRPTKDRTFSEGHQGIL